MYGDIVGVNVSLVGSLSLTLAREAGVGEQQTNIHYCEIIFELQKGIE